MPLYIHSCGVLRNDPGTIVTYTGKKRFNEKAALLKEAGDPSIEEGLKSDEINPPPPDITKCSFEVVYIRSLVDYYQKKRLLAQIAYFKKRAFFRINRQIYRMDSEFLFYCQQRMCSRTFWY